MFKVSMHDLWFRKRRLVGMSFAVLLGVAFLAGTLVLGDTMRGSFDELFTEANEGTDVVVRSDTELESDAITQQGLLDDSLVEEVAGVDGVQAAAGEIIGLGQIIAKDGDPIGGNGPPTLAGNWIDDPDLNAWRIVQGRPPRADDEVVIDKYAAGEGDLKVGSRTIIQTPDPIQVTIVGIARFGDSDSMGTVTFTAFTTEAAQQYLLDGEAKVTSILAHAETGVTQRELACRIQSVLPPGAEAITGRALTSEQRQDIDDDFLNIFEAFLVVFAGIALLVAMFSINNAFSILVAQRTRESALLRAVGASRSQVLIAVAVEALIIGVIASLIGIVVGIGLAAGLRSLLNATGFSMPEGSLVIEPSALIVSFLVGVLVTLPASALPAIKASRVPPLAAMRDVAIERVTAARTRRIAGAVVGVLAIALVGAGAASESLPLAGLGALFALAAMVLLGPVVAIPASAALGWPLARFRGLVGSLSRRNAMRNPRRTAGTASALMVGVAVVTLFTVFAASLKAEVDSATSRSFRGDLVIAAASFSGSGLSPQMTADIGDLPEVATAAGLGNGVAEIDGEAKPVTVADPSKMNAVLDLDVQKGAISEMGDDGVAISQRYADDNGLKLGDPFPIKLADGATPEMRVAAIYDDAALVDNIVIPASVWNAHATQPSEAIVLIKLAKGVDLEEGRAAVEKVAKEFAAPDVQDREEFVESVAANVDQFLAVIYVLLALAIFIALMGIANTLSLSIHERTRELGLLRAVGETRGQMRAMVRGESMIVALFGTLGGLVLGVFLGWGLVRALASEGIESFAIPGGQLLIVFIVGAAAGVLAGLRPAGRAAKMPVLDAISGA